jgi:hypothetical protein
MREVTLIVNAIKQGDSPLGEQLLSRVYDELRRLAVNRPDTTLDAKA